MVILIRDTNLEKLIDAAFSEEGLQTMEHLADDERYLYNSIRVKVAELRIQALSEKKDLLVDVKKKFEEIRERCNFNEGS